MANAASLSARAVSTMVALLTLAGRTAKRFTVAALVVSCVAVTCLAQDQSQDQSQKASSKPDNVTIPSGEQFALVLTNPVSSKTVHRGDEIHAQTTSPVTVGDQVVIPAGTFVQGKVDKLSRDGTRGEFLLQSAQVIFPDGYILKVAGPLSIESDEGTAWRNPSSGAKAGMFLAPLAGFGIGAGIGAAAHTTTSSTLGPNTITSSSPKGIAIGSLVGLAAGGVVALVLIAHSHQFFVDVGSPMEMTLQKPVTVAQNAIDDALREAKDHPAQIQPLAPRPVAVPYPTSTNNGTCFTPGSPGTPPTIIPGAPDANGIPGPPTIIPGTPPTPGTPYPCP